MLYRGKEPSAIRKLFEQGKKLKEKYGEDQVFDFSIGNPSVPSPAILNESLIALINDSSDHADSSILHGYTSAAGDMNVRQSISSYLNETYDAKTDANYIYMSVGAAAGLSISLRAIVSSPDDEVIVFAPFFPEYEVFIDNAKAKTIVCYPDYNTFYPDTADFESKITKNTKAIIINSPNNPTGIMYKEDIIVEITKILKNKEKEYGHPIYLISDEPYRELIFYNERYPFITNYYDNSIITYSFSKSLSIPGERIGYILVNPKCEDKDDLFAAICGAGRSLGYVCAPSIFQYMIPKVLGVTSDVNVYKENANLLYDELKKIGYHVVRPDGAFYMMMKALEDDDQSFSDRALEYNLLLVPSASFGVKGYVRIAFCQSKNKIIDSIPQFKKLYSSYT